MPNRGCYCGGARGGSRAARVRTPFITCCKKARGTRRHVFHLNPTLPCSALPPLSPLQDVAFDHVTDKKKRSLQKWKREWGVVAVDNFIEMVDVVPLVRNAQSLLGQDAGALHVQGYLRSQGDGVGVSRIRDAQRTLDAAAVARRTHFSRYLKVGTYVGRSELCEPHRSPHPHPPSPRPHCLHSMAARAGATTRSGTSTLFTSTRTSSSSSTAAA